MNAEATKDQPLTWDGVRNPTTKMIAEHCRGKTIKDVYNCNSGERELDLVIEFEGATGLGVTTAQEWALLVNPRPRDDAPVPDD